MNIKIKNMSSEITPSGFLKKWRILISLTTFGCVIIAFICAKLFFPIYYESEYTFPSDAYGKNALTLPEEITIATIVMLQDPFLGKKFSETFFDQLKNASSSQNNFDPYQAFIQNLSAHSGKKISHTTAVKMLTLYLNRNISKIASGQTLPPWFGFLLTIRNENANGWYIKLRTSQAEYGNITLISAFNALQAMIESFNAYRSKQLLEKLRKDIDESNENLKNVTKEYGRTKAIADTELQEIRSKANLLENAVVNAEHKLNLSASQKNDFGDSAYFQMANWLLKMNAPEGEFSDESDYTSLTTMDYFKINNLAIRISKLSKISPEMSQSREFSTLEETINLYSIHKRTHKIAFSKFHSAQQRVIKLINEYNKPLDPSKFALGKPIISSDLISDIDSLGYFSQPRSLTNIMLLVGIILGLLLGIGSALAFEIYGKKHSS